MKIAIPTDDGVSVSAHFGHAAYFLVAEIEAGQVVSKTLRSRPDNGRHEHHDHHHGHDAHHAHHHGHGPASKFQPIRDCHIIITGGMGQPAVDYAQSLGMKVALTDHKRIDDVLAEAAQGVFYSNPRRIHRRAH
ncbi:MAG: hypothetical protein GXP42_05730 [Chloroflexi bacterium]|nr:hypothetical protein [Chloroflexota bacterium]